MKRRYIELLASDLQGCGRGLLSDLEERIATAVTPLDTSWNAGIRRLVNEVVYLDDDQDDGEDPVPVYFKDFVERAKDPNCWDIWESDAPDAPASRCPGRRPSIVDTPQGEC